MLLKRLKWAGLAILAGWTAAWILIQNRLAGQLRENNSLLRAETQKLVGLVKENEILSNRLAQASIPQPAVEAPTRELLRLRGEIGVLRRQLQESQSPAWSQTNLAASPSSEDAQRTGQALRIETQAEIARVEARIEDVQSQTPEGLARATFLSREDGWLRSLLEELASAERRLAALRNERGSEDAGLEDTRKEVADMHEKIQKRTEGILLGLNAKLAALKSALQALEGK